MTSGSAHRAAPELSRAEALVLRLAGFKWSDDEACWYDWNGPQITRYERAGDALDVACARLEEPRA